MQQWSMLSERLKQKVSSFQDVILTIKPMKGDAFSDKK